MAVLMADLRELTNSIRHLQRSNRDLQEALSCDDDVEFREALLENGQVLARKRHQCIELVDALDSQGFDWKSAFDTESTRLILSFTNEIKKRKEREGDVTSLPVISQEGGGLFL
uniref:Uncharacterized protein n=1 Tax=Octactis speculum TaxID=3111310 RepID=A0A7S2HIC5_9STRA|mmetsp:Transcript_6590/g.8148  ORF Transcript_6590/g.8148 Transcript_6590/m.8148 type:complete len:114 (+) Transcript_6590:72-413(+)